MKTIDLDKIRIEIDKIDDEIASNFEKRMELVAEVAEYKKANHLPVRDAQREAKVLDKASLRVKDPNNKDGIRRVMREIIEVSVRNEEKTLAKASVKAPTRKIVGPVTVGYQGVEGAYSHVAVLNYFKNEDIKAKNYSLFEDVLKAVKSGEITYGVLPIENSSTGGITEVYDLMRRYGCYIVGEQCVKVEHNLLVYPGTKMEDVTEVYSHPQGFAQCREFFKLHPQMKQIPYFNTAKGAEFVAQAKSNYMAAVAGENAAKVYNLEILAKGINQNSNNYTRFFIIADQPEESKVADKITLVVSLRHEPGSLYRLLRHFEEANLNLLNLESRPIEGISWEYFFHIDVSGNLEDPNVKKTLEDIKADSAEFRILGNYVADKM